jgi:two-component system alkaline phosphatase synthesis response regulator PhoP
MGHRILLVEDEPGLCITLNDRLRKEGYSVEIASDGDLGFSRAEAESFDLLILDLMLPGKNGFEICRDLREHGLAIPILMLTARDQVVDKVQGLKIGADDYLTKPFDMLELLARVEALMRRATRSFPASPAFYEFGSVRVDFRKTEVLRDGFPVAVSAKEFQLLRFLIENRGETLTREKLLREVWNYTFTQYTRTVEVHIAWLRQKLEDDPKLPRWIVTVHGIGYRFETAS